jgi:PTS system ascorbate-specific IIC component
MQFLIDAAQFLANNFFSQPALLIGLIAMLGLIVQRKDLSAIVTGTVKTIVGFRILTTGSDIIVNALKQFTPILQSAFGMPATTSQVAEGVGLGNLIANYGGIAALIMTFGFLLNMLIARLTHAKYIYLTGHLLYWVALLLVAVQLEVNPEASAVNLVVTGSLIAGVYWTLQPALTQKMMAIITGGNEFALGHSSASFAWLSGVLGKWVGSPDNSTEKIKLPKWLSFFKDPTVSTATIIGAVVVVAALVAGPDVVQAGNLNYLVFAVLQGFNFSVGITVLLIGVRMVLDEIVPAFKGIALKIIPGAKPALDCPAIFNFAPTAVLIGFLCAFAAFMLCMLCFGTFGWSVIIPPMITLFFTGGTCGVFGNATGGLKGAILGGLLLGIFLAVGQAFTAPMLGNTAPELAQLADPDWYLLVWVFKPVMSLLQ